MTFADGLRLLGLRAQAMAEAAKKPRGSMAAVLGMDEESVRRICLEAGVDLCNLNLPTQTVIGGEASKVQRAIALAKEQGAQRVIELNVSGAFHSRLMRPAATKLAKAIESAPIAVPEVPVIANANAKPLSDVAAVRSELVEQVASPVRWHESVTLMATSGVTSFIEFGPGNVLTGLVRRLTPGAKLLNIGSVADLRAS
jgi:[acyl-carrier-protein] S-malonyltransferase